MTAPSFWSRVNVPQYVVATAVGTLVIFLLFLWDDGMDLARPVAIAYAVGALSGLCANWANRERVEVDQ